MEKNITEHYFQKFISDRLGDDKKFLNKRVFDTIDRFVRLKAGRPLSGSLLDVGCGDGGFVSYCNEEGLQAKGVDIVDGVNFETDRLPYPDHSFGIVTMFSVIEHIREPSNILTEVRRVLTKDGLLVIITPNVL